MTNQVNIFVKMNNLKNKPYFGSLRSKCGIYELADQLPHFTDEVLITYRRKASGLFELLVRLNSSDYFADVSGAKISDIMKDAVTVSVDPRKSTTASKVYEMAL